jgi:hypothetical protein
MSEHRRGNQKINNSEKLDTYDAQDEVRKKNQRNMYESTNTNNVNKTWVLLQTTGGKDERDIVFMLKS